MSFKAFKLSCHFSNNNNNFKNSKILTKISFKIKIISNKTYLNLNQMMVIQIKDFLKIKLYIIIKNVPLLRQLNHKT